MLLTPVPFFRSGGLELSFFGTQLSTDDDVEFPAGIASGDLCICIQATVDSDPAPASVLPTNFTNLFNDVDNRFYYRVSYKILTGSETTLNTGSTGAVENVRTLAFRPNKAITSVTASGFALAGSVNSPGLQSVSSGSLGTPQIIIAYTASGSSSYNFSSQTPSLDNSYGRAWSSGYYWRVGYKLYNSSPSNHSVNMADEGSYNVLSIGAIVVT